jgi:peroxiredoxin
MSTNAAQPQIAVARQRVLGRTSRAIILLVGLALGAALAAIPAWKLVGAATKLRRAPGQVVPDFALRDVRTGQLHRLSDHEAQVVVIIFCGTRWPMARTYLPRLSAYSAEGEMRKIDYVGINANANESGDDTVDQARALRVRFPMLKDAENRVADLLAVERIGEALVIDRHGRLRYRGAIDDQFNSEPPCDKPSCNYLLEAIDAVLAGRVVSPDMTPVAGPPIERIVE